MKQQYMMREDVQDAEISASTESSTLPIATPTRVPRSQVDPHLVSLTDPESMEAECYRRLRLSLETAKQDDGSKVFAICSPSAGDGKTLTSVNLAGSLAQDSAAQVLLMELDLRKPRSAVADMFGLDVDEVKAGLIQKMSTPSMMWGEAVSYLPDFNLNIMFGGGKCSRPYELLKSDQLGEILTEARERYDFVIVDTPPIVLLPDSQLISRWVDKMLLVVTADRTSRGHLEETLSFLGPDQVMGLVMNGRTPRYMEGYYDYASTRRASGYNLTEKLLNLVNPRLGRDA